MTQTVTAEDGQVYNFPDEATPAMMAGVLGVQYEPQISYGDQVASGLAQTLAQPSPSLPSTAMGIVNSFANPAWSAVGNGIASSVPQPIKDVTSATVQSLANSQTNSGTFGSNRGVSNTPRTLGDFVSGVGNSVSKVAQDNPQLATVANGVANLSGIDALGEGAINLGKDAVKNIAENGGAGKTLADLIKDAGSSAPFGATPPPPTYDAASTHAAINKSYESALQTANQAYDWMRKTATGKTIDASGMIAPVKEMISDIETDPFHEARTSLPKLRAFVDQATENPKIPLSDAVDMKQDINSNFNPKRFTQGAKTPYFQVGQMLDSKLAQAGTQYPLFGSAKTLADQTWVNIVAQPFTENSVLQKFWKPEDYYAQKSVKKGLAEQLPDATQKRAANMLDNVTDPVELNAVTRVLPSDMASTFKRAKLENITNGAGTSRLESAKKTVNSALNAAPLDTAKNFLHTIIGREYTPQEKALIQATKSQTSGLPIGAYQAKLGALKAGAPPEYPLAITYKPQTPSSEMLAGQSGIREATPQELSANEAVRQRAGQMGMYPASGIANSENIAPAQASALSGASQILQQYGSAPLLGNENIPPPIEKPSPKGAMGNAAYSKQQRLDAAKKIADMEQGQSALGQINQLSPEDIQSILNNREEVEKYQGASPFNTAMRDELLKAFKRNGK